ncbi:MAG: hypothetical protein Alpg2KO_14330 [Alphaproteobacteria bacterium]
MPDKTTKDRLLTFKEASVFLDQEFGLKVSYWQLHHAKEKGTLPFFKSPIGGKFLIRESALIAAYTQDN